MKKRKKLVTEKTIINIDEVVFKIKAQELQAELFVEYVNKKCQYPVLELKLNNTR
ncbi:hypothetical protein [Neobacillus sp. FSL H8-0543]|uniref:hypothetical protein n=1 Tax=Neobacillus sp. FSL H8-0543 TaxID=2954672 RepID=UPI00315946CF